MNFHIQGSTQGTEEMRDELGTLNLSVAMAQPMFLSENGHCVPNKIPKILKIFKGVEGAKS